jgi:gamma-glutamyl:cysteine ligase YbdK (ATP-grasp superfamily)
MTRDGKIVPIAPEIIPQLAGRGNYGYELSACQLELRTDPVRLEHASETLRKAQDLLSEHEAMFDFKASHIEVAPIDMPLDVYPDPTGRYQVITKNMPTEILRAACRVAGTHIHIGMADPQQAVRAYNAAIRKWPELCRLGDKSQGERLEIYKVMAPDFNPPEYAGWEEFEKYAASRGFTENPRNCWHLIRISMHGTIEFRMFGATPCTNEIAHWAEFCHDICSGAL